MSDNPTSYAEKAALAEGLVLDAKLALASRHMTGVNEEVLDTDYAAAITRQWHKVVDDLADARARKADLGVQIKRLVEERGKLVPLVRLVAPGLLERNGDVDE